MAIYLHKGDLPKDVQFSPCVAVDTETLGLIPARDKLCLIQLSDGNGDAHIVQFDRATYNAPNVIALMKDKSVTKIFHYARFDVAILKAYLNVECSPVYCTKIASRIARTYTDRHGLKHVVRELTGIELNKQQQSSDWGADELSQEQLDYAASDVLYLHAVKEKLDQILAREGRTELAQECFNFLKTRADLDLEGWSQFDIFEH